MKRYVLLAALIAAGMLSACGKKEEPAPAVVAPPTEQAAPAAEAPAAPAAETPAPAAEAPAAPAAEAPAAAAPAEEANKPAEETKPAADK